MNNESKNKKIKNSTTKKRPSDDNYILEGGKKRRKKIVKRNITIDSPNLKIKTSSPKNISKDYLVDSIIKDKKIISKNTKKMDDSLTDKEKKKIFAPEIRENNNILIRLIKMKLQELQIPEKALGKRFDDMMEFNNFKRALIIRDSITIEGFARWMEILNVDWEINFLSDGK